MVLACTAQHTPQAVNKPVAGQPRHKKQICTTKQQRPVLHRAELIQLPYRSSGELGTLAQLPGIVHESQQTPTDRQRRWRSILSGRHEGEHRPGLMLCARARPPKGSSGDLGEHYDRASVTYFLLRATVFPRMRLLNLALRLEITERASTVSPGRCTPHIAFKVPPRQVSAVVSLKSQILFSLN